MDMKSLAVWGVIFGLIGFAAFAATGSVWGMAFCAATTIGNFLMWTTY